MDEIARLDLSYGEIQNILGSKFRWTLTSLNFESAEERFGTSNPVDAYKRRLAEINYAAAKLRLAVRFTPIKELIEETYDSWRTLNLVHFVSEKTIVVATGHEPVLNKPASQLGAAFDIITYLAFLKGAGWVLSKARAKALMPISGKPDGVRIKLKNGKTIEIEPGKKISPSELELLFEDTPDVVPNEYGGEVAPNTGKLAGSGPKSGFLEISGNTKSANAVKNFQGKKPVDFRYDPESGRFVMGNNPLGHSGIPGFPESAPGGRIRFENGKLITDEWSGHYGGKLWTPAIRAQFVEFMKQNGVDITHTPWGG
ncbi:polymorphic toxin type 43 domain-containing protein [Schlesneria sp. T3-172]|uniref:polymorphic toxin type 43 domain-containing protein n=1 Tax=Schlesneria sphaerica TaxID=3373610 RepID=UPI0037C79896